MAKAMLYVDMMSQPSRACAIFVRVAGITDVQEQLVNIAKGGTVAPAYRELFPLGKVPALQDGDLKLPESAAIMTHLARTRAVYPSWTAHAQRL